MDRTIGSLSYIGIERANKVMKRLLMQFLSVVALIFLVMGITVVALLSNAGFFKKLEPHYAGVCSSLDTAGDSAEDILIDRHNGIAYLSALDRRGLVEGKDVKGSIKKINLNAERWQLESATTGNPANFRPHGMSLFTDKNGLQRLFVINDQDVEVFEKDSNTNFSHSTTIRDPLLFAPNDLVAVGPNQFYVANDSGAHNQFERIQETVFARGLSSLIYFDGNEMREVVSDLKSSGGISAAEDGRKLFVGETIGRRIQIFERETATGQLTHAKTVDLDTGVDNLDVDSEGRIWLAGHPNTISLIRHFIDSENIAPTHILRLQTNEEDDELTIDEIYYNHGEEFSAGSVAVAYENKMLVGSITERKILVCEVPRFSGS